MAKQNTSVNSTSKNFQEKALLNRLDIRRSLAKYAAAESKIKLEVAKQTPDISLSALALRLNLATAFGRLAFLLCSI